MKITRILRNIYMKVLANMVMRVFPQTTCMRSSLTNASALEPESDIIVMRSTSFLQFLFISVHIISFLTSGFLRLSICVSEDSPCST